MVSKKRKHGIARRKKRGHNARMSKRKANDRHKPSRMVRIREPLAKQLKALADKNASSMSEEANRAVRLLLEQEGLWPVK